MQSPTQTADIAVAAAHLATWLATDDRRNGGVSTEDLMQLFAECYGRVRKIVAHAEQTQSPQGGAGTYSIPSI